MDYRQQRQRRLVPSLKTRVRGAAIGSVFAVFAGSVWADTAPSPRLISVNGEADVSVVPDRAQLQFGVSQVNLDIAAAQAAVSKIVKAYVAEAKKLGARDADVSTTGLSIQPEYVWDDKARNNRLTGYRVSRSIGTRVTDLDKLGDYLLAATHAGINQAQPPELQSSKADDLKNQALAQAAKNAQAKAKLLADTLGVKLASVYALNEDGAAEPPRPMMMKAMVMAAPAADSGNADMGIEAGEIRYHASVSAQFEVQP